MVLEKHSSASNHTSHTNNLEPPTPTDLNNDKHRTNTTNTTTSNSVMGQNSTTSAQPSVSSDFVFDESLFTAAFKLFDEKKIGRIYKSDLIKVLRAAGHNPSEKEIEEIHQSHHIKEGDMIQLEKVNKYLNTNQQQQQQQQQGSHVLCVSQNVPTFKLDTIRGIATWQFLSQIPKIEYHKFRKIFFYFNLISIIAIIKGTNITKSEFFFFVPLTSFVSFIS